MNKNVLNSVSFSNCPLSVLASLFLNSHYLSITTFLSFPKTPKLIFLVKYFESYVNFKLGHFVWDTLYIFHSYTTQLLRYCEMFFPGIM